MNPDHDPVVRQLLETRLDTLQSGQDRMERDTTVHLNRIEGRVSRLELKEAQMKAAAEEHRRMVAEWKVSEDKRSRKKDRWTGILPTVIASVISGLTVGIVLLLI